jgi:UDP-N-acetylglucosamine 2-epimerase (non-hydrolysing)
MKILIIVGTRPEAIKMAPVCRALKARRDCTTILLLTGQHRDMTRSVLELFDLVPDIDLDVMQPNQSLTSLTARLTAAMAEHLGRLSPDAILVQGDTTSAMIGGLLGFYSGCRVGHVEAGLRTGKLSAPYPEEFNRRVIALSTHWHFAPTALAAENLRREGITENVHVVGNTVVDAVLAVAEHKSKRLARLHARLPFLSRNSHRYVLVTTHRRENFGEPMRSVAEAVRDLAGQYDDVEFVVPVHPNPIVGKVLRPILERTSNVHLVPPLDYEEMIHVLRGAHMVLTDSGGLQEEAPAFGVPVLVLRNETERMEGVAAGCSLIVGTERAAVREAVTSLFTNRPLYDRMARAANPYGDGNTSTYIADIILGQKRT